VKALRAVNYTWRLFRSDLLAEAIRYPPDRLWQNFSQTLNASADSQCVPQHFRGSTRQQRRTACPLIFSILSWILPPLTHSQTEL
jgi:hypothetical protein